MPAFRPGDRVTYDIDDCGPGTVVAFRIGNLVGVRFDRPNRSLHSLDGNCDMHHGWWCIPEYLTLLPEAVPGLTHRAKLAHQQGLLTL